MNIRDPLPKFIEPKYHDEAWRQPLDYVHIPFRCHRHHEYGNLFRAYPLIHNKSQEEPSENNETKEKEDAKGFQEVQIRNITKITW